MNRTACCTLLLGSLAIGLVGGSAWAETDAATTVRYYDDGKTQVLSPTLEVGSTFNEDRMKITGHVAQDILTSASSEVVTYSSRGVIEDQRNEYQLHVESQVPDGTLAAGFVMSDEKDYSSRIFTGSGTREFFTKNTVVAFAFSAGQDHISATGNTLFHEGMQHQGYSLSLSQILSKNSLLQLIYDFRVENGYLASPYRKAKIVSGTNISTAAENHPRTRNRHAIGVKYNYFHSPWKLSFATSYRLYQDSWDVLSHTLEERVTKEFGTRFEIAVSLRYYMQSKAKFYSDYYYGNPGVFFTGNNTLSTYDSISLGVRPAYAITDKINVSLKLEAYIQSFKDATDAGRSYATMSDDKKLEITAFVAGAGLTAKF